MILLFVSCSGKSQSINKITYNSVGGEMGGYVRVQMTKDSITGGITATSGKKITIREKTPKTLWDSLTRQITIKDFREIKSGKSVQYIDGIDISVKIETDKESYSLLNGDIDRIKNKKVFYFMEALEDKLRKISLTGK